jgi:hypothetical protein
VNMGYSEMKFGFSTGSIARNDFRRGLDVASHRLTSAVELSALREQELEPLLAALDELDPALRRFEYISVHAPSKRAVLAESVFVQKLGRIAERSWPIIVHPDVIEDVCLWRTLGNAVCIENLDRRKACGRTAAELAEVFRKLPEATFCFDIGHARQVDPTMQEAETILRLYHQRLRQVHMSYVNSQSRHERLNYGSVLAFRRVAHWLSDAIPIILETPVDSSQIEEEIAVAKSVFYRAGLAWDSDRASTTNERKVTPLCVAEQPDD